MDFELLHSKIFYGNIISYFLFWLYYFGSIKLKQGPSQNDQNKKRQSNLLKTAKKSGWSWILTVS